MNKYMQIALDKAHNSGADVPVGALIVKNEQILSISSNKREKNSDISAHAEILAIQEASQKIGNWRLEDCELYVTLEPCPMCAWAILQSRIKTVYFGSYDLKYGALGSKIDLRTLSDSKLNVIGGIMEKECDNVINEFWQQRRK